MENTIELKNIYRPRWVRLFKFALLVAAFFGLQKLSTCLSEEIISRWADYKRSIVEQAILDELGGFNFTVDTKRSEIVGANALSKSDLQKALYYALATIETQNHALESIKINAELGGGTGRFTR